MKPSGLRGGQSHRRQDSVHGAGEAECPTCWPGRQRRKRDAFGLSASRSEYRSECRGQHHDTGEDEQP